MWEEEYTLKRKEERWVHLQARDLRCVGDFTFAGRASDFGVGSTGNWRVRDQGKVDLGTRGRGSWRDGSNRPERIVEGARV